MRSQTHGPRRGSSSLDGFTLIEMILVVLVILILAALTVAVVGRTMDGDRVRGAGRQIQNYLAGARDRAIYAASRQENTRDIPPAIGVRFLANPSYIVDDPANPPDKKLLAFGSMVFVQEVEPLATWLRVYLNETTTPPRWEVSQLGIDPDGPGGQPPKPLDSLSIRSIRALIDRGLVNSRMEAANPVTGAAGRTRVYYLPVYFDRDASQEPYFVQFVDATGASGSLGGPGNQWLEVGVLSKAYPNTSQNVWPSEPCKFRLLPAPMPSEEPRLLPTGTVIDVESSVVGGAPPGSTAAGLAIQVADLLRGDGSFDILFNSRGVVEGPLAATGLIHLVVADGRDIERGFRIWTPYVDVEPADGTPDDIDGDLKPDERLGDELIVSIRTQTGSIYSSDIEPAVGGSPAVVRTDPFRYAELGGEAK